MALSRPAKGRDYRTFLDALKKPLTEAQRAPRTKPAQALADAIVDTLAEHGPQSAAEMAALLPLYNAHTIRTSLGRMARTRRISRVPAPKHETLRWKVGPSEAQAGVVSEGDQWTPGAWVHPIRRRLLGLPVAERREVPEMDFGNPLRRKAA